MKEVVIKIPDDEYKKICAGDFDTSGYFKRNLRDAFRNGTPLPKGHGRIVDIGQISKDMIEKDNPIICLTDEDGVYLEVVSLDYLDKLTTIIEADTEEG